MVQRLKWNMILRVNTELRLEVCTGNILRVDLGTKQEPSPRITIKLAPKTKGPIFETIARDPKIGGSALGYLKARIWQQRTRNLSVEPPIKDLELWLDQQADQLGTPTWWEELKAFPGIMDLCKFTQKICTSFHVAEIWSRVSPVSELFHTPSS